jgi:cytochrome c oxidase cbb3-type subunit IV
LSLFTLSTHSTYDMLRHLADSWGLVMMGLVFAGLCLWPFRPGAGALNEDAAHSIFEEDSDDQR